MAAQYYKINYKSDFVLTINSDAGWAVPFCIKFWTGMPSQAYFAGFDGENYVNCRVGETPTQLLVMFDDHHMPIGELKMQIAYHTTIEDFPDRQFDEVTNPTNVTVDIDGTEYQVMLDFTGESGAEIDFSMPSSGVMSVNGKIGYVTLNAEDVGAQPTIEDLAAIRSGAAAGATAVQPNEMTAALATKQNVIGDLATIRSGAAAGATAVQPAALQEGLAGKQDTISDLSTIRSGAAAGATAYQKPGTGIPKTDLASSVQSSLNKADAAAPQSSTYTKSEVNELVEEAVSHQTMIVTISSDGNYTADKTFAEIKSFLDSGGTVMAKDEQDGESYYYLDNYIASEVVFTRNIWGSGGFSTRYYTIDNTNTVSFIDSAHFISSDVNSSSTANLANSAAVKTVNDKVATKQDTISDLATIRSGAAAGATAVQPAALQEGLAGKQDTISDLSTIRSGASAGATAVQPAALESGLAEKQDTISDLATIRSGAAAGATAVQPAAMNTALAAKEDKSNKVTSFSSPTDTQYPSAKLVSDQLATKQGTISDLSTIRSGAAAGATAVQPAAFQEGLAGKQDTISDLSTIRSGASAGATAVQPAALESGLAEKQDTISDLATIRSGAAAGATAVQPAAMNTALAAKQDMLTFDNAPTANSDNPVKSSGIKIALDAKQSTINTVNVTVDNNTGTPSGSASVSGSTLSLSFQNLKGATGATGATGPQGPQGERGLPGESGVTGDVSSFTVIQTIDPSATYGATDIAGAATVQATNQELTELEGELNGGKAVAYYTSEYLTGLNYIENPLVNGKEYKLTVHQTQATWMRFGFAKDNSGTDTNYIHLQNAIGDYEYTFNAPDPTIYPYMVIQKPNTDSTMEVSYTSSGLIDTIEELQSGVNTNAGNISTLQDEVEANAEDITELKNEIDGGRTVDYYTTDYISGFRYLPNQLVNGKEYTLNVHQTQATWMRFGFAKDNSGTGAYYIHEENVIDDYEYTFNAPDPSVYPYMVVQKPNADSTMEVSHISDGIMTDIVALQGNVSDLSAQTSEIDIELNGIDEQVYYTSAYLSGYNYVENPLVSGREYKLFIHQTQATYMRFGFAKDNSGTGAYYIHETNVIDDYEYTFNAPDPSVYPYMVVQKPNTGSTFEIRYIVEGFAESIEVLQEDVDGLKGNTFIKTINEQEIHLLPDSYKTDYIPCPMFKDVTYLVSLKLIGHTNTPAAVVAHRSVSNTEVGRISLTDSDYSSGDYVEFTPTEDAGYLLINFNSTYREPSGASMILNVEYGEKTAVSAIDIKPLNGRKFIMLGDSITQLPRTETTPGGVGIVEWFSHFSGAEVIRGAVGGRRLTRTGTKVTTASEITEYNIAVSFFDVIGLAEALASGDFSLQRAAYQWLVDNNYSPDAQMIYEVDVLDALDMSKVDAITIFAGTNDWHNNVTLQTIKDAIDSIVETLLTAYPKLTIYFFTPIVRFQENNPSNWSDTWQNNAGLTIPQYVDAIMEQAKANCIPVCDLYHGMGWTRYNVTQYIPIGDGTHPRNGFGELAAKMFGFVNSNWPKVYRTIQAG